MLFVERVKQKYVPRGGNTTKSFTTTNLIHHLTAMHPEIHAKYLEKKANKEPRQPKETRKRLIERWLSLIEVQDLTKVWDIKEHRAQKVYRKVGKMLAIDC